MDVVPQLLAGSSERSTLRLKLSTAWEDKGKKYGCTAFLAISLGVPPHYEASSASPPRTYQPPRSMSHCVMGFLTVSEQWARPSPTKSPSSISRQPLTQLITMSFVKPSFQSTASGMPRGFSAASASSPSPHLGYFLGPPSLYLHASPT